MPMPSLAAKAADLRQQLEAIERLQQSVSVIRETIEAHPSLLDSIAGDLQDIVTNRLSSRLPPATGNHTLSTARDATGDGTTFQRMKSYFVGTGNKPVPLAEIAEAISASEVTLRQIVYKRHKGDFLRTRVPDSNLTLWRLNLLGEDLGYSDQDSPGDLFREEQNA